MGNPYGNYDTNYDRNYKAGYDYPRYGASVEINDRGYALFHIDRHGTATQPLVESHKEGIRIGCTFVTTDALEKIYKFHQKFLKQETSVVHQAAR